MKQYETYKESGAEWIGEIPESWKSVNLKWISNITKGKKPKVDFDENGENLLPYLSMEFLRGKTSNPTYASIEEKGLVHIDDGDILILWDGSKAGEIVKAKKGILSSTMAKIEINDNNFESNYLNYLLQLGERHVQEHTIGMGIPHVSGDILKMLPMLVPSPQEQTQIATYLDFKTGLIDSIISQKEDLIKKLKEQRQAIINEAVTKGLNKDVKLKDSGIEWLGDIPEHWVISKFKYFATIRNGKDQKGVLVENGKYPILGTGGEFGRASEFLYDKPSVLLGRKGTIDKPQFIEEPFWTVDTLFYTEIHEDVSPKYLFYLSTLIPFNLLQESSAVPSMTQDKLHNVFLTKPIKEEQNKIVKHIENEMNKMDLLISKAKESIQKLKEYRQSLISEAVTGKIDVRDWQAPKS